MARVGPEAMIARLPAVAPFTPPETGASMAAIPRGASKAAIACAAAGPEVDRSTNTLTAGDSAILRAVSRASAAPGTLAMTTAHTSAASAADLATLAPSAAAGAMADATGSYIVSSCPAAISRATIPEPMRPTPMKAIFSPTQPPLYQPAALKSSSPASAARIEIDTHCIGEAGARHRIARQHQRIVARNDVLRRTSERLDGRKGVEVGRDIVHDRKWPPLKPISVEMRRIRRQHHPAALCVYAHDLQAARMAADAVQCYARRQLGSSFVINHATGKQLADHGLHIAHLIGRTHDGVAHCAAGAESHLVGLQVVTGARKQLVVARVIVVHVADEDIVHLRRIDPRGRKPRFDR